MIEMWDDIFISQRPEIKEVLEKSPEIAFENMHKILDEVWEECDRVLMDNGFVCINIGDATRTIDGRFRLFSNHSRIIKFFARKGYDNLPDILWRKSSNAPNKFMGSGMYPAGAYVTYEHEYILIFRKGGKREFKTVAEKENRRESAYFWEERNIWFSDLWEKNGVSQKGSGAMNRERTAAFPFEIPHRIINMYSVKGDTVLDPFLGTGTTLLSSIASERNSIGVEIDKSFQAENENKILASKDFLNEFIENRMAKHIQFSEGRENLKYTNENHNFKVTTRQEKDLLIRKISEIKKKEDDRFTASYSSIP
jgi:DNA modification methylase